MCVWNQKNICPQSRRSCSSVEWFGSHPGPAQVPSKLKHTWWWGKGQKHTQHKHKWTLGPTSWTPCYHVWLLVGKLESESSFPCNSVGMLFCGISPIIEWSFGRFGFSLTHARTNTQTRIKLHRFLGCILLQFRKHQKRKWKINGHPKWGEPTKPWKWRTMLKQHWNKYKQRSLDWNKTCEESTKGQPGTGDYTLPTLLECT